MKTYSITLKPFHVKANSADEARLMLINILIDKPFITKEKIHNVIEVKNDGSND